MKSLGLWDSLPLYQVLQPFPLHTKFINHLLSEYEDILVIEETTAVIEMQMCIDPLVCTSCGVCLNIYPREAIIEKI